MRTARDLAAKSPARCGDLAGGRGLILGRRPHGSGAAEDSPSLFANRHDNGGGNDDFFRLLLLAGDQCGSTEGNERDGFHVLFQVLGQAAFRVACAEPSLQELPRRVKGIQRIKL